MLVPREGRQVGKKTRLAQRMILSSSFSQTIYRGHPVSEDGDSCCPPSHPLPSEDRKMTFQVPVLQSPGDSCPYRKKRGHRHRDEVEAEKEARQPQAVQCSQMPGPERSEDTHPGVLGWNIDLPRPVSRT